MLQEKLSSNRQLRLFALGALLGIAAFLLVYGFVPLDVTNDAFCRGGYVEKDIQQHYAGWLFYRQSSLSFPPVCYHGHQCAPGHQYCVYRFHPAGSAALQATGQFAGWYLPVFRMVHLALFCAAGRFRRTALRPFLPGHTPPGAGILLFVSSPILYERAFRHTSLGAQWMVLAALYLYFRMRREGRYASLGLFLLNVAAIGIHPYFLPMTYGITLALLLQHSAEKRQWKGPCLYLAADLLCTLGLGWLLGFFYGTATSGGQALYGYFSMNLNALWNPAGVNGTLYSHLLPAQNQVNGNYDAFAYLGLGVLVALPIVLILARKRIRTHLARHWALTIVCVLLTVFANQQHRYRQWRYTFYDPSTGQGH